MKTTMKITLRAFPVKIQDTRTGKTTEDKIILTKEQLHAADLVGQSSKELTKRGNEDEETRAAIARMLPCLHSFKSLRTVLDAVNSAYLDERRQGADVCNLVANSGADEEKEQEAGNEHGRD